MVNGTLISFEGPEGAGKSSVLEAVLPLLEEKGIPFITTREPGGVDIAEKIRQVILDPDHTRMDAKTELLLYIASRRQRPDRYPRSSREWPPPWLHRCTRGSAAPVRQWRYRKSHR